MRNFISTLLATVALAFSVSGQPLLPIPPATATTVSVTPSVRPSQAVFYDGFDNGYNTPWLFYQATYLFKADGTNGVLQLKTANTSDYSGLYAYVKGTWTNISVQSNVRLTATNTTGASVGLRYDFTKGSGYSAWIYKPVSTNTMGRFVLKKYNNWYSSFLELASVNIPDPGTNLHTIKISATNNIITARLNDSYALAFTDSAVLKPGGISLSVIGGTAEYDNVTVYNLNQPFVQKPQISAMTKRIVTTQGSNFNIKITASGNPQYKWYFGGSSTPIPGATNDTLTVTNAATSNAGFYKVTAENLGGETYGTANATVFTTNILSECILGPSTITFNWDYDFTNNPTVGGFKIYDGNTNRTYTNITFINAKVLTGTVSNLVNGATHYFAITAKDTNNFESDYSSELSYTPPKYGTKTNMTTNIYFLSAFGYPAIQTKVCPNQSVTFWYTPNLTTTPFQVLTNIIADEYGNAVYDDVGARGQSQRFYKLSTP